MRETRTLLLALLLSVAALVLVACGARPLLANVEAVPATLNPTIATAGGASLDVRYTIGCAARVSIALLDDVHGSRYVLRSDEPRSASADPYVLRFDGTVPVGAESAESAESAVLRRVLPAGRYTAVVEARSEHCGSSEARVPIVIEGGDVPLPDIENLVVWPATISPNADAIDDVAEITYRLPVTSTVDVSIHTPQGTTFPLVTRDEQEPAEWSLVWNGKRPDGTLLQNGVYTCTVRAEDAYGNLVHSQRTIVLEQVGEPEATITYARIAPQRVMLGRTLTVTVRVKNSGPVPIRTYGPPSGYRYTTNEVYSSVEGGRYTAQAGGFWRVGVDWDANSGDGPRRYPFRWALSERRPEAWQVPGEEDWLLPGEEVEIIGHIVVLQRETKMGFYVGLIQDGVGFFQDRTARTIVEVGF